MFPGHGENDLKRSEKGSGGFVSTDPDLADILD